MIKTYHECPNDIFWDVQALTSGDYWLVHLFKENEKYLNYCIASQDRESILDNSVFELEEMFDAVEFASWVDLTQPTTYIIPDKLEDAAATMESFESWDYDVPGRKMGVVQGKSIDELKECYSYMADKADVIGISFDYSLYEKIFPDQGSVGKLTSWMHGRRWLLYQLREWSILDETKPHHLLGIALPQEVVLYANNSMYGFIESIDTSNPVVHGLKGIIYSDNHENYHLHKKESQKLHTMIDDPVSEFQQMTVEYNIKAFAHNCGKKL